MPYIKQSNYPKPTLLNRNSHFSTIYPSKIKKYPTPIYIREKIITEDGDFLNLDWRKQPNKEKLVILFHGLEGDSKRTYLNTCSDYFFERGYTILAWNQRTCGGEMNKTCKFYHHGSIDDVDQVVQKAIKENYKEIILIGYSMGGAMIINYLGAYKKEDKIKCAITFSVPLSLHSCSKKMKKGFNKIYFKNFARTLVPKFREKAKQFPGKLNEYMLNKIKSFDEIDEYFTAPLHGYSSKDDYYEKTSPLAVIKEIKTPCLIVNAKNDPFLGEKCFPIELFRQHKFCTFEMPEFGGHCGFPIKNNKHSWAEIRAYQFVESVSI